MAKEALPPVDPAIRVPRAVLEAAANADAAQKASLGISEGTVIEGNVVASPPAGTPPALNGEAQPSGAAPPAGATPAPAQEPPAQEPPAEPANEPPDWERRYKTLHGRAEADRKRSRETISELTHRLTTLEERLAVQPPPAPPPAPRLNVTPEELEDYGEDFFGLIRRVAEGVVDGKIAPLSTELGRTKAQIGVHQVRTMHQQMDALYPQWQDVNRDPRFIDWVALPDPYSGAIRQRLMQEAWDTGDARRVFAFIQGFLAEEAALNPQGRGQPRVHAPAAPNGNGAQAPTPPLNLASLAAPGGARSASHTPAEKPVYTTEDITRFYTEVAAGRWRHREQERQQIDADIMRAQHENRIVTGQRRVTPPAPPQGYTR